MGKNKLIIVLVIALAILAVVIYNFGSFGVDNGGENGGEILDDPIDECARVGGEWMTFPNGCVDSCFYVREENVFCATVLTDGCDCGVDRCWDGESCVGN